MNRQASTTIGTVFLIVYTIAVIVYGIYGWETGTGLSGYLMDYQMRIFGAASMKGTFLAVLLIGVIPALFLVGGIGSLSKKNLAAPIVQSAPAPMPAGAKWSIVLAISVVAGLVPLGIYGWLQKVDREDQQRAIYQVDFRKPGPLAADAKFVYLSGYRVLKQQLGYRSGGSSKSSTHYAPLVDSSWTPDKPVTYFYAGGITRMPDPLSARLEPNAMPVFVRSEFLRKGVKVASQHYLIHDARFGDGTVASSIVEYVFLPWLGLGIGVLVFLFGSIVLVAHGRAQRRLQSGPSVAFKGIRLA